MNRHSDPFLFEKIKNDDEKAFEALFRAYYPFLCHYATQVIKEPSEAEEIVQELFLRLWEKRKEINIEKSVADYLFRAVKNSCFNHIKHIKIKKNLLPQTEAGQYAGSGEEINAQIELSQQIEYAIASLPDKRREIFRLSRQEGLKYKDIAARLNISIKTVETQMGLAIKTLREKLRDYLPIL